MISRQQLLDKYISGIDLLHEKVSRFSPEEINFKPSENEWSIKEIIIHLADSETNAFIRYRSIISEPGKKAFLVAEAQWAKALNYQEQPIENYFHLFRILRNITYNQLTLLPNDDDIWKNRFTFHDHLGEINLERWLQIYADHLDNHLKQMDRNLERMRIKNQPAVK